MAGSQALIQATKRSLKNIFFWKWWLYSARVPSTYLVSPRTRVRVAPLHESAEAKVRPAAGSSVRMLARIVVVVVKDLIMSNIL